jgi:hypothetical protein
MPGNVQGAEIAQSLDPHEFDTLPLPGGNAHLELRKNAMLFNRFF